MSDRLILTILAGLVVIAIGWFFIKLFKRNKNTITTIPETTIRNAFRELEREINLTSTTTELSSYDKVLLDFWINYCTTGNDFAKRCYNTLNTLYGLRRFQLKERHTTT